MANLRRKIIRPLILIVAFGVFFGAGFFFAKSQIICKTCAPEDIDFSLFWSAYNKIKASYVDTKKIDNQKIIYGAISGMADSLGDPYTAFFDPEDAARFEQDLSGSFEGIGAEVGIRKDLLTIIAPLEGTPAQKAGLKSGDIILKIDGKDTTNMTSDEAVNLIRGKKGTDVVLNIYREEWQDAKDITITRGTIKIDSMKWELKEGDIAYIHIYQFDQALPYDFRTAGLEILSSPAKKIVLDLRDDPGGYLEVAQEISGWFLENGQTITVESFGDGRQSVTYKAQGNGSFSDYPTVVLVNEGSASASEILAGALRDNRKVQLVGQKTFGKGSVQEVHYLSDGSFLKITIAKWLTPNGSSISEVGLEPDVKIELSDQDIKDKKDPQLDKALEIIKNLE